jgi:hypothetical protein
MGHSSLPPVISTSRYEELFVDGDELSGQPPAQLIAINKQFLAAAQRRAKQLAHGVL